MNRFEPTYFLNSISYNVIIRYYVIHTDCMAADVEVSAHPLIINLYFSSKIISFVTISPIFKFTNIMRGLRLGGDRKMGSHSGP